MSTKGSNALIILGFTGDLSRRKLLPALYNLEALNLFPKDFLILGVTRRQLDENSLKELLDKSVCERSPSGTCDPDVIAKLSARIKLVITDISKAEEYPNFKQQLDQLLPEKCLNKLFYFAIPPSIFEKVITNMVEHKIEKCGQSHSSRLLIEKPFGHDLTSAENLIKTIEPNFGEDSIYRIDHYLAKDMTQNILHFRFHNPLVRSLWNSNSISSIQISAIEDLDIQGRSEFYEQTGALRDMIQGHLLQLLALTTMDEPSTLNADDVRRQRQLLLQSVKPISCQDVDSKTARGQYQGYRDEVNNQDSKIETFASLKLEIDNARWRGVPVYLRAGKAMHTKFSEINVIFDSDQTEEQNILTFRLQPAEGIAVTLATKKPGLADDTKMITLDYCYQDYDDELSEAYDRILFDALRGDQTLFPTDEEIITCWQIVQPVLDSWQASSDNLEIYPKGNQSLANADNLLASDNNSWVEHEVWVCNPR